MSPKADRPEPDPDRVGQAILAAVDAAPWLTDADQAAVELALQLGRLYVDEPSPATARVLVQLLTSLGLTVAGRPTPPPSQQEVDPLHAIQERARLRLVDTAPLDPTDGPAQPRRRGRGTG